MYGWVIFSSRTIANQSINRSINRSINQSINQFIIDQSINQSFDRSINQSINWSMTQSVDNFFLQFFGEEDNVWFSWFSWLIILKKWKWLNKKVRVLMWNEMGKKRCFFSSSMKTYRNPLPGVVRARPVLPVLAPRPTQIHQRLESVTKTRARERKKTQNVRRVATPFTYTKTRERLYQDSFSRAGLLTWLFHFTTQNHPEPHRNHPEPHKTTQNHTKPPRNHPETLGIIKFVQQATIKATFSPTFFLPPPHLEPLRVLWVEAGIQLNRLLVIRAITGRDLKETASARKDEKNTVTHIQTGRVPFPSPTYPRVALFPTHCTSGGGGGKGVLTEDTAAFYAWNAAALHKIAPWGQSFVYSDAS